MKTINASVTNQNLTIEQSIINVAGSVNAYALKLTYDAEWDEVDAKIVTFSHGAVKIAIKDDGDEAGVTIPHEVLTFPGIVTVGVVGYEGTEVKLTTTGLYKRNTFVVLPEALGLSAAITPTPDIYVKLVNKLEELQGDYDNLSDEMGSLSDLETQNKDNLVAAINEVLNSGGGSGTVKSVNHKDPDADGNVALTYTDIPGRPSLATVATTGNYNDLTNKPTIPTVNDATLTIQKNGTDVATFTANSATNQTANITVPTTASDIGAEPTIDSEHKLASDLVDDTDQTNKFATADDLSKLAGIESGAEVNDIDSISVNGTAVTPDEHKNVEITVPTYTAGTNVQISSGNVISATDTTYSNFTGTDGQTAGAAGLVPAPATTDAGKFLKADGTWDTAGGGVTPVQTTGTSTTDVMSQDATTKLIFADIANAPAKIDIGNTKATTLGTRGIKIGAHTRVDSDSVGIGNLGSSESSNIVAMQSVAIGINTYANTGDAVAVGYKAHALRNGIAIGSNCNNGAQFAVAIGQGASAQGDGSVAIGNESKAINKGEVNIGTQNTSRGWNGNSNYRVLRGVYDAQDTHDAVNLGQLQNAILNGGTTAPTTATVGAVGTLYSYVDTGNNNTPHLLICTDTTGGTYTWSQLI